jgi:hypothetical protein
MWEEQPAYQKAQAAAIGVGLLVLLVAEVTFCVLDRDWHLLAQVLLLAGALVFCLALLSLTARLLVRLFTRRRNDKRDC